MARSKKTRLKNAPDGTYRWTTVPGLRRGRKKKSKLKDPPNKKDNKRLRRQKFRAWLRKQSKIYPNLPPGYKKYIDCYLKPKGTFVSVAKEFNITSQLARNSILAITEKLERHNRKLLTERGKADWIEGLDLHPRSYMALKRLNIHTIHDARNFMKALFRDPSSTAEFCLAYPSVRRFLLTSKVLCSLAGKY